MNKKTGAGNEQAYLLIDYSKDQITFAGSDSARITGSGTYIPLTGSTTSVEFVIYDKVSPTILGMYVSPPIEKLGSYQQVGVVENPGFNWGRFTLWMSMLIILAFIVYIMLQEWYKRRYEAYLFRRQGDLYNVINFMHNSRKSGADDGEIERKLKNSRWNGEQISYAFKKLDGKRTGMFEIPIFRFFEQKKVRAEIEMRRAAPPQGPGMQGQLGTKPL
jgi:hypothetical protein